VEKRRKMFMAVSFSQLNCSNKQAMAFETFWKKKDYAGRAVKPNTGYKVNRDNSKSATL